MNIEETKECTCCSGKHKQRDEKEKKDLISYLIKEVQIYPNDEPAVMPLKSITLNFPIYIDNKEVNKLLWDKQGSIETLAVLTKKGKM